MEDSLAEIKHTGSLLRAAVVWKLGTEIKYTIFTTTSCLSATKAEDRKTERKGREVSIAEGEVGGSKFVTEQK